MHDFENPLSGQTLAEGIREYFAANPGLAQGRGQSPEAQEFFRCHDAAHIVFGCGNTLEDEAIVKLSSVFGTTGGISVLRGYRLHESLQIYKTLKVSEIFATALRALFFVPVAIFRCTKQHKRWPWSNFEHLLNTSLHLLRAEYGIRVPHQARDLRGPNHDQTEILTTKSTKDTRERL
jgi:hypothetical protein